MKRYVAGFCFNYERTKVALILKNKPAWQKGFYNAIGGKIEEGEEPIEAMVREFKEETGADVWAWNQFVKYTGSDYEVYFFKAFSKLLESVTTTTDEVVRVFDLSLNELVGQPIIGNLDWLIPMALDINVIHSDVTELPY